MRGRVAGGLRSFSTRAWRRARFALGSFYLKNPKNTIKAYYSKYIPNNNLTQRVLHELVEIFDLPYTTFLILKVHQRNQVFTDYK